ncbi:S1 family peptidase [Mycolicibacter heraklionensis]|uniref:S1 family peptidase n=1 Tax=Mycolicibacter heraklionensis TaxID=512402 RepID=A0A9X7WLC1_9MYCO|nr:S1 family peptidase [Mycolicibacter heraklionensis]QZA09639.1 S1 family peptidase [Mycolicibacter heraklionensis]
MQFTRWRLTLTLALLLGVGLPAAPPAAAMVILGGGAVIIVDGNNYCTLTTIGRDRTGDVVGFTGAQCGGPGAAVTVAGTDATVGTVVAVNGDLRYAVIKFDVPDLIPVSDYAGIAINGLGPEPQFDSLVCKWGPADPGLCGRITTPFGPRVNLLAQFDHGDVGAPVTMDGLLVGMVYAGGVTLGSRYSLPRALTYLTKFSAILDDVNAGDGPGSGFVPIGS